MAAIVTNRGVPEEVRRARPSRYRARRVVVVAAVAGVLAVVLGVAALRSDGGGTAERRLLLGVSDLTYSSTRLRVETGTIALAFANTDAVPHTFTVPALGVDVEAGSGEAARASFDAEPGTYDFLCTIPGHDTPGMRGVLTVTR